MRGFSEKHGAPPTVREIAERFRFTPRAAFDHLRALERKGRLLRRGDRQARVGTLVLADRGPERAPPGERDIPSSARSPRALPSLPRNSVRT